MVWERKFKPGLWVWHVPHFVFLSPQPIALQNGARPVASTFKSLQLNYRPIILFLTIMLSSKQVGFISIKNMYNDNDQIQDFMRC